MIDFSDLEQLLEKKIEYADQLHAVKSDLERHHLHQATNKISQLLRTSNFDSDIYHAVVNKLHREIDPVRYLTFVTRDIDHNWKNRSPSESLEYLETVLADLLPRPGSREQVLRLMYNLARLPFDENANSQEKLENLVPLRKEFLHFQRQSDPLTPYIEFQLLKTSIMVFSALDRADEVFIHSSRLIKMLHNLEREDVFSLGDLYLTDEETDNLIVLMTEAALRSESVFDDPIFDDERIISCLERVKPHLRHVVTLMSSGNVTEFRKISSTTPGFVESIGGPESIANIISKIQAMAFVLLIMRSGGRRVTLEEIASATDVERKDAEGVVLKAFANDIAEGFIDGVTDEVVVTRTSSRRVKTAEEVARLRESLQNWAERIVNVASSLSESD